MAALVIQIFFNAFGCECAYQSREAELAKIHQSN